VKQFHLHALEPCSCGAYRYLAAREHKKSFEILEIHQLGTVRNYRKVASVDKVSLAWHDVRNRGSGDGDSLPILAERLRTSAGSILAVVTKLEARDK
jgi:hypothetical protein